MEKWAALPSNSNVAVYETTPKNPKFEIEVENDDNDDDPVEEEVKDIGRKNFSEIPSPYLTPYLYTRRFLDKQYRIRRKDDGRFFIGDSTLPVDDGSDISLKGKLFQVTRRYGSY